jgi:hypothetical protein
VEEEEEEEGWEVKLAMEQELEVHCLRQLALSRCWC